MAERRFEEALPWLQQAVERNPQLAPAHHNLGVAQFRLGRFAAALRSFDRTIELGNSSGLAYSHRAAAKFALGDAAGAAADFQQAQETATPVEQDEVLANFREFEARRRQP